jgi:hypothetical protein
MTVMEADTKATTLHRYRTAVKIDTRLLAVSVLFIRVCASTATICGWSTPSPFA